MKQNKSGKYEVTEGAITIKDPRTNEEMFFLIDEKHKVVLRSMLENDIKNVVSKMDATSSTKRKRMRYLSEELPQKGSEKEFFVAEKIIGQDNSKHKRWNKVYGLERAPIGIALRDGNVIRIGLYQKEKNLSMAILDLAGRLAEEGMGIKDAKKYFYTK